MQGPINVKVTEVSGYIPAGTIFYPEGRVRSSETLVNIYDMV